MNDTRLDKILRRLANHERRLQKLERARKIGQDIEEGEDGGGHSTIAALGTLFIGIGALIGPILLWLNAPS